MPGNPIEARAHDLQRWLAQFPDTTPIGELRARHHATCVGVICKIRVVPGRFSERPVERPSPRPPAAGAATAGVGTLELSVTDGTGSLVAVWIGRTRLPGLELGAGLRLSGTVSTGSDGSCRMLNPVWELVREPYS